MTPQRYITEFIGEIVGRFSKIACRYEYDEVEGNHKIEILPTSQYENNLELNDLCIKFICDFLNFFPDQDLNIIDDKVIFPVVNPIFSLKGSDFISTEEFILPEFVNISPNAISNFFNKIYDECINVNGFKNKIVTNTPTSINYTKEQLTKTNLFTTLIYRKAPIYHSEFESAIAA